MFRGKGYFCHIRCHESNCSKCYCPFKHSGETDTSKDILTAVDYQTGIQINILKQWYRQYQYQYWISESHIPSSITRIRTVKLIPGKAFLKSESRTSVTFKLKCWQSPICSKIAQQKRILACFMTMNLIPYTTWNCTYEIIACFYTALLIMKRRK